jgi:hypothetical protein
MKLGNGIRLTDNRHTVRVRVQVRGCWVAGGGSGAGAVLAAHCLSARVLARSCSGVGVLAGVRLGAGVLDGCLIGGVPRVPLTLACQPAKRCTSQTFSQQPLNHSRGQHAIQAVSQPAEPVVQHQRFSTHARDGERPVTTDDGIARSCQVV